MRWTRQDLGIAAALAAVSVIAYLPALSARFIGFDDPEYVFENPHVLGGLTAANSAWAWTTVHAQNWHPLTWLSLQLDATLFGPGPAGFHAVNVALHAANAAVVFFALAALTGARVRSALVAALFAVHPLHVESVAWVTERKDVLSAFFGFLALWAYAPYVRRPSVGRYLGVAALLALSLLAKPMLVTLPFLLLVLDWWPLQRPHPAGGARVWLKLVAEKLPLLAMCVALSAVTLVAQQQGTRIANLDVLPAGDRLKNALVGYAAYLQLAIVPVGLAPFYPYPPDGWPAWRAGVAALVVAALTAVAVAQRRGRPYLLTGWLWYLGTLVPVIGFVQVGTQAYADRYTYFPLVGVFLALVWAVAPLCTVGRQRAVAVAVGALLLALAALTWVQAGLWQDDRKLWPHTLQVTGPNAVAHNNLGTALERGQGDQRPERERRAEAIAHFKEAVQIKPDYGLAHFNLALALDKQGGPPAEVFDHYRKAVDANPLDSNARINLGIAYARRGRFADAEEQFREAVRLDPNDAKARVNLASTLSDAGRDDEAVDQYREAVRLNPADGQARLLLGLALEKRGDLHGAADALRRAAEVQPGSAAAQFRLGNVLEKLGEAAAVECFRQALKAEPKDVHYRVRLARALARRGAAEAAAVEYREALRAEPHWPEQLTREGWQLATAPTPPQRNGEFAVWELEGVCDVMNPPPPAALDALAAAYAETGRFPEAVAAADKARAAAESAGQADAARAIADRLALYRDKKPFHRPPPAPPGR